MYRLLVLIGFLGPGCDEVFPLTRHPAVISIRYDVIEARNHPDGTPSLGPVDADRVFGVVYADGTVASLVTQPDGSMEFAASTDPMYRFIVSTPGETVPVEYQLGLPTLVITESVIGRHDRAEPDNFTVRQQVTGAPASSTSALVTTGLWTQTAHNAGGTKDDFQFAWKAAKSRFGPVGVVSRTAHDRAYAISIETRSSASGPYSAVTRSCENTFNLLGALISSELSCGLTARPLECAHIRTQFRAERDRIDSALPPLAHPETFYGWFVGAAPAPTLAPPVELELASRRTKLAAAGEPVETDAPMMYANPYPGHAVHTRYVTARERVVTLPSLSPMIVDTRTVYWTSASCEIGQAPAPVAVAGAVALDGTRLDADDRNVVLDPARPARLTWDALAGSADLYRVVVHEVVPFFGGTFRLPRHQYVVTEPSVLVDPGVFIGTRYLVEIEARLGHPNVIAGDLGTTASPETGFALSTGWSSMFTVTR